MRRNPDEWEDDEDDEPRRDVRDWIPDSALEAINAEKAVHQDETEETTARRLLRENVTIAVMSIAHTAAHGSNERVRLDASKYIIDRVLGRVGDDAFEGEKSPVESFVDDVVKFAEAHSDGQ